MPPEQKYVKVLLKEKKSEFGKDQRLSKDYSNDSRSTRHIMHILRVAEDDFLLFTSSRTKNLWS